MSHPPEPVAPDFTAPAPTSQRLLSLDAFRGFIMLLMASAAFGIPGMAHKFPNDWWWQQIGWHCDHAAWVGCTLWDLIQPAFMFMVGVALTFSVASRAAKGQGFGRMALHAVWRSLLLILLAVFLTSAWSPHTDWIFTNVLAQIGLGYPLLFRIAFTSARSQALLAGLILAAYWACFAFWPLPPADFDWSKVGIPADWPHLTGFAAHWDKNANFAAHFDQWFLNLFPRDQRFEFNKGGYQTLNFVPALATMIFGLLAGRLLRGERPMGQKIGHLVLTGLAGLAAGALLAWSGACPMVKRIWTPSFALFSAGWVLLMLAFFVTVIEWARCRRWALPLVVVGLNPITLYVLFQLMGSFITDNVKRHFGAKVFQSLGSAYDGENFGSFYEEALRRGTTLLILWLIVFWMYRRKIVVRL